MTEETNTAAEKLLITEHVHMLEDPRNGGRFADVQKGVQENWPARLATQIACNMVHGLADAVSPKRVAGEACALAAALWREFNERGWIQEIPKPTYPDFAKLRAQQPGARPAPADTKQ